MPTLAPLHRPSSTPHTHPAPCAVRAVFGGLLCWGLLQASVHAQEAPTLQVKPGDTASALAWPHVPEGATLDQMLVALLRANPDAFIDDNVNLLRAGQLLRLPETAQVLRTHPEQARNTVLEHHSRFREYAQRLAAQAHRLPEGSPRALAGKVSTPEAARTPQGSGQDKLTLTKDLQDAQAMKIALEKQTQEALVHLAALQKNIEALQKLSQASEAASTPASPSSTPTPAASASPRVPVWAWIAGLLALSLTVVLGLRRRDTRSGQAAAASAARVVVPPQMAGINLDLDGPASAPGRQP